MKIQGQYTLPVPQDRVWQALLDPEVLARTLPGCESLEAIGPDEYRMKMKLAVQSVQGLFEGKVRLKDQQPPTGYELEVDGRGKIGFVNGSGRFTLEPAAGEGGEASATTVHYQGDVKVGGVIAAVGQRLLDMTSKMMIKRFFASLSDHLTRNPT
jgi:carbon monoxide dehydrogenase subunit G